MTKISLVTPNVGELNTAAEPRVTTALKEVEKFLNEKNIESTDNLKKEGIAEESLSKALQEKFTNRVGLTLEKKNESLEGVSEKLYYMEKAGSTLTLPAPTANRVIGVFADAGATGEVKITASAGKISGGFIVEQTTITLTRFQYVLVEANGTNWLIVGGEPKRTQTYSALTERVAGEYEPSATRDTQVVGYVHLPGVSFANFAVGGVQIVECLNNSASLLKMPISFRVPAGVKWKWSGEGASVFTSYLGL